MNEGKRLSTLASGGLSGVYDCMMVKVGSDGWRGSEDVGSCEVLVFGTR